MPPPLSCLQTQHSEHESISQNAARFKTKVTASHAYSRSCTEINHSKAATIDSGALRNNSPAETNNAVTSNGGGPNIHNTPKRGFQHVYQSMKTPSSLRVHAAHNATVTNNAARTKNAMKRNAKKKKKINNLWHVVPSPMHSLTQKSFLKSKPIFFSGISEKIVPNPPPTTVGLKPNRGHTGITESWPNKLSNADKCKIVKLMKRCKEVAKGYLPSDKL
jgi:hypothetical protein